MQVQTSLRLSRVVQTPARLHGVVRLLLLQQRQQQQQHQHQQQQQQQQQQQEQAVCQVGLPEHERRKPLREAASSLYSIQICSLLSIYLYILYLCLPVCLST
eukprot:COSAG06_NODE_6857_length_2740_cov_2.522693_1_plen_102_part_00